jgi:hypothetical protein
VALVLEAKNWGSKKMKRRKNKNKLNCDLVPTLTIFPIFYPTIIELFYCNCIIWVFDGAIPGAYPDMFIWIL